MRPRALDRTVLGCRPVRVAPPRTPRDGFTLIEGLLAGALVSLLVILLWQVFGRVFGREGPLSFFTATSRSLVLQQSRQAIRKLFYRIQEGIQVLEPPPGRTDRQLVFRDLKNYRVRLRHLPREKRLVTERYEGGAYVKEIRLRGEEDDLQGIQLHQCESALFTVLTPTTVCVSFTTYDDRVRETFMTVITLINPNLDP